MINQLEQNLEKFKPGEMWKPAYYQWLLDFLDETENRKLYFWVEGEEIMISNANPPKYYGKPQDFLYNFFTSKFKFKLFKEAFVSFPYFINLSI